MSDSGGVNSPSLCFLVAMVTHWIKAALTPSGETIRSQIIKVKSAVVDLNAQRFLSESRSAQNSEISWVCWTCLAKRSPQAGTTVTTAAMFKTSTGEAESSTTTTAVITTATNLQQQQATCDLPALTADIYLFTFLNGVNCVCSYYVSIPLYLTLVSIFSLLSFAFAWTESSEQKFLSCHVTKPVLEWQ